jgi:oligopeptide/dipeptide ABC transporter ATP-binding protein
MIAIALSCEPRLLIADEATTALDVTIQAQILELMKELTSQLGTALLIITHNLGIIARYADRLNVMYAGKIRESGTAEQVYLNPAHPYTIGLLNSVPRLDRPETDRLDPIPGEIPDPSDLPSGCAFWPRCRWAVSRCQVSEPALSEIAGAKVAPGSGQQHVACFEASAVAASVGVAQT